MGWSGWEQQEAEPQGYGREMHFQWAAVCSIYWNMLQYTEHIPVRESEDHRLNFTLHLKHRSSTSTLCTSPSLVLCWLWVWVNDNVFSKDGWKQWIYFSGSTLLWFSFAVWTKGSCIPGDPAAFLVMSVFISSLKDEVCPRTDWAFGGSEITKGGLVKSPHLRV